MNDKLAYQQHKIHDILLALNILIHRQVYVLINVFFMLPINLPDQQ